MGFFCINKNDSFKQMLSHRIGSVNDIKQTLI